MYQNKTFVALIPARGGSVSIPKKNIYPLNGKPLIRYTIEAAEKTNFLDDLYCSTDDADIAYTCSQKSKCKIIKRPPELASNEAKTIDTIIHALNVLKKAGKTFDYFLVLQPTSPLRTSDDIDDFIKYVVDHDLPSCVSVAELPYLPILMRHVNLDEKGVNNLKKLISGNSTVRRQDAPKTYYVDGSLYAYLCKDVMNKGDAVSLNDSPFGYISNKEIVDINVLDDIFFCEYLLSKNKIWEDY